MTTGHHTNRFAGKEVTIELQEDAIPKPLKTGQFAHREANRLLSELAVQVGRTARNPGEDEVHDLRVAIRRLKSVLTALELCFLPSEAKKVREGLKAMMGMAGAVRDRDIALRLLADTELVAPFTKERENAAEALSISLQGWVHRKSQAAWRRALRSRGEDDKLFTAPVGETAAGMLPKMAKEHYEHGKQAARANSTSRELHKFRIATKKLRYTLDVFAPVFDGSLKEFTEALKDIQTVLGESNDLSVVGRMVPRRKDTLAIRESLKKKQQKKADRFRKEWPGKLNHGADRPLA